MGIHDRIAQFMVAGLFEKWGFHEANSPGEATLTLASDENMRPFRGLPADKRFDGALGPGVPVSIIVGHKMTRR